MSPTDLVWRREELLDLVRQDIWRYLTPAANIEDELLEAAALLKMNTSDLRSVAGLQFLTCEELGQLLDDLPYLVRKLSTTTAHEEEWSAERVRGAINWSRTVAARQSTGMRHLYVTTPSRRAFQTPENELLVFLLDETVRLGRLSGWHRSTSETAGLRVSSRVATAERWSQSRMLTQVERRPVTPRGISRVRSGRARRRYGAVIDTYDRYRALLATLDRDAIRESVETHGLASRDNATVLELLCTFEILRQLQSLGWHLSPLRLIEGSLVMRGKRGDSRLDVTYQQTPKTLSRESRYRDVQRDHDLEPGGLRPDLVLRIQHPGESARWTVVEVKGGERGVVKSARAAAYDLLAYRSAFDAALARQEGTFGLGIAWGSSLPPKCGAPIVLCTPDTLQEAIAHISG